MTATVLLEVPFSARGDRIPDAVAELRTREPIRKVRTITGAEAWLVSSYALCTQVLEDRRFSMKETAAAGAPRLRAHQPICAMTSPTRWPLPCTARFWASRKKTARSCSVA